MLSVLTNRERQIFEYLIKSYTTKQIASLLHISEKTVRNHISNVIIKLDVNNRSSAILKLIVMKELSL